MGAKLQAALPAEFSAQLDNASQDPERDPHPCLPRPPPSRTKPFVAIATDRTKVPCRSLCSPNTGNKPSSDSAMTLPIVKVISKTGRLDRQKPRSDVWEGIAYTFAADADRYDWLVVYDDLPGLGKLKINAETLSCAWEKDHSLHARTVSGKKFMAATSAGNSPPSSAATTRQENASSEQNRHAPGVSMVVRLRQRLRGLRRAKRSTAKAPINFHPLLNQTTKTHPFTIAAIASPKPSSDSCRKWTGLDREYGPSATKGRPWTTTAIT